MTSCHYFVDPKPCTEQMCVWGTKRSLNFSALVKLQIEHFCEECEEAAILMHGLQTVMTTDFMKTCMPGRWLPEMFVTCT